MIAVVGGPTQRLVAGFFVSWALLGCDGLSDRPLVSSRAPAQPSTEALPQPVPTRTTSSAERARSLARRVLIVDGHVDAPHRIWEAEARTPRRGIDLALRNDEGDFDFVRANEGGLDAPFMSVYVPSRFEGKGAKRHADRLIDGIERWVARSSGAVSIARSPAEVRSNFARGVLSLPMGIENGAALEGDLSNLAHFHARGIRYVTLVHARDNRLGDSATGRGTHGGLSAFGREIVAEMNRLGIMIDVSHLSDEAFFEVLSLSRAPVIASHSSCRHFTPAWRRNLSDAMIRALAAKGGIIMINFGSHFLVPAGVDRRATVETVADHIEHVVRLVGLDFVGLGSDFDGVGDTLPEELEDVARYPNLFRVLLDRGYDEDAIEAIAGKNLLRVWEAAEASATKVP